jgi:hypothetical protein
MTTAKKKLYKWKDILAEASDIVDSYDVGVTLRQLFYRLVVAELLPNIQNYYRRLSHYTAEARRNGTFPDLLDKTSSVDRPFCFTCLAEARSWLRNQSRRDRTEGQPWTIYLGVEKDGMSEQLRAWFSEDLGLPLLPLGGYASQTLVDDVRKDISDQGRPAALIYAGDHDPTGEDIPRDFEQRVGNFKRVLRMALTPEQVEEYSLPFNPDAEVEAKLERDPRAAAFRKRHGALVQYEMDALPPETLRNLYQAAIDEYWDVDAYEAVLAVEEQERNSLD